MKRKPSHATTELTLFAVSKDKWNTKEGTDKSMKNAFYVLWYAKRHLSDQWKNVIEFWEVDPNHIFIFDHISHYHMNSSIFSKIFLNFCGLQIWNYLKHHRNTLEIYLHYIKYLYKYIKLHVWLGSIIQNLVTNQLCGLTHCQLCWSEGIRQAAGS